MAHFDPEAGSFVLNAKPPVRSVMAGGARSCARGSHAGSMQPW
jgi:hypothetical protein